MCWARPASCFAVNVAEVLPAPLLLSAPLPELLASTVSSHPAVQQAEPCSGSAEGKQAAAIHVSSTQPAALAASQMVSSVTNLPTRIKHKSAYGEVEVD